MFNIQYFLGELLSLNFQLTYDKNIIKLNQDTHVFGLGWLDNETSIKQTPLLNVLVLCGICESPPAVVSNVENSSHMIEGKERQNINHGLFSN